MIPMSAKTQVMAAYVVIVAMASMGESLLAHGPFPEVPKVTESAGTDMTLVIGPAVERHVEKCVEGQAANAGQQSLPDRPLTDFAAEPVRARSEPVMTAVKAASMSMR
jgi:hypothetical protein